MSLVGWFNWRMVGNVGYFQVLYVFLILGAIWAGLKLTEVLSGKMKNKNQDQAN